MASQGCEELSFEAILGQFLLSGCIADTNLFREHYPVFRSVAQQFMGMFRADLADCIAMLLPLVCTEVFVSHPTERGYQRVPLSVYSTHRVGVVTTPQGMSVKKRLAEGWQKLFQIQATLNQARSARSQDAALFLPLLHLILFVTWKISEGVYFSWGGESRTHLPSLFMYFSGCELCQKLQKRLGFSEVRNWRCRWN